MVSSNLKLNATKKEWMIFFVKENEAELSKQSELFNRMISSQIRSTFHLSFPTSSL